MFQPARLKRAMVASCRLPLGMPRRSLSATGGLRFFAGRGRCDGPREATHGAFVTDEAVAFHLNAEEKRVIVAVGRGRDNTQSVAAGFALHPQLLAGAAPEGDEAGFEGFCVARGIEE